MRKIFLTLFVLNLWLAGLCANANVALDKALRASSINKSAVSVSVRNIKTGEQVYNLNSMKPVNPASTQKLVTFAAALDTLGEDYVFSTELYKSTNNDLYLKLSADPYLTSKDLKNLFSTAKSKNIIEPKGVYIDDYVLDSAYWGEGWQWDDDLNTLMPKFGSYNLDSNILKITVKPTTLNSPAEIYTELFYPIGFVNLVKTGSENNIRISHNETISHNLLEVNGTIRQLSYLRIPVNNIKLYFRLRLEDAINDSKVFYYGKILQKKLPKENVYLVDKVERPISQAAVAILQNSNNMIAETVYKLAGGKFVNNTGSINSANDMFLAFCKRNDINPDDVRLVDGSGVSKNNLMTADFMTKFLTVEANQPNFEFYKSSMAGPGVGTLRNRMLYFGENLKAKTGTLSDVSAIAGYIKTRKGNEFAFDIMINDAKSQPTDKKMLEEMLLRAIYSTL